MYCTFVDRDHCMGFCKEWLIWEKKLNVNVSSPIYTSVTSLILQIALFWPYEQSLPVNQICVKGVFLILLVTGCFGHLRSALTKMALISPSTCPALLHSQTPYLDGQNWKQTGQDSGSEGWSGRSRPPLFLYSIVKFNVRPGRASIFSSPSLPFWLPRPKKLWQKYWGSNSQREVWLWAKRSY